MKTGNKIVRHVLRATEWARSAIKEAEQRLSLKGLKEQAKGVELFPMGSGGPLKGRTWQMYASGGLPTSGGQQAAWTGGEAGVCNSPPHAWVSTWKFPQTQPVAAQASAILEPPYAQDCAGRRPGENENQQIATNARLWASM